MRTWKLFAVASVAVVLCGCKSETSDSPAPDAAAGAAHPGLPAADELCEAELGATAPVHSVGNVYLAGQPSQDDLAELAARGIRTVVTLRKPEELDWDEEAAVEAAGMDFVAVPFDGHEELTDDVFEQVRQVLAENADEPLVLHCGRANRVGAVWMVHRVLDDGLGIEAALEEAQAIGLRTPEYIEKAKDYIRREQGAGDEEADAADASSSDDR
jgi:uncharacterized protein (TIGR01244 family)